MLAVLPKDRQKSGRTKDFQLSLETPFVGGRDRHADQTKSNAPPACRVVAAFGAKFQFISHRVIATRHSGYATARAFRAAIDSDQGAALPTPYDPASSSRK
jgi:hypothetical protein